MADMALISLLSLFGRLASPFLVPAKTASAVARRRGQGRPPGRRARRAFLDGDEHGRTVIVAGSSASVWRGLRVAAIASALTVCAAIGGEGHAQVRALSAKPALVGQHVADASRRSGLPQALIRAVAEAESGGAVRAISPKGAMGLMQIMPATWRDLRADLGLGDDPFDPRDNLLAGAVYLRRMLDRFGAEGFLGAYNAGPSRYQAYLDGKHRLPSETIAYVAHVRAGLPKSASWKQMLAVRIRPDWRGSGLFVSNRSEAPDAEFSAAKTGLFPGVAEEAMR